MRTSIYWAAASIVVALAPMLVSSVRAADPVAVGVGAAKTAATIASVGKMLDAAISKAIEQADDAAAARLRQLENELKRVLNDVERLGQSIDTKTNDLLNDALSDMHGIVLELRDVSESTTGTLADTVNGSLAQASTMLDALPLVSVDPYLSAISPRRLRPDLATPEVRVHGYFGQLSPKDPPTFYIDDKKAAAYRIPGGYRVELPIAAGKPVPEGFYRLKAEVPKTEKYLWFFDRRVVETWTEKIFVQRLRPYVCSYQPFVTNPESELRVKATVAYTDSARTSSGGRRPSVNDSISAEELFIKTVPNAVETYDTKSARILKLNESISGRAACQAHAGWSGRITRWDQTLVQYELKAGDIGPHEHKGWKMQRIPFGKTKLPYFYVDGGGGSHADLSLLPEFVVAKKGVEPLVGQPSTPFALKPGEGAQFTMKLPANNWAIHVRCEYHDGDPSSSRQLAPMILTPNDKAENAQSMQSRIENTVLYVTAR
jgi:hypothetical protein